MEDLEARAGDNGGQEELGAVFALYDPRGTLIYEDMGCKEIKVQADQKFPSAYECNHLIDDGCIYQNQIYKIGKSLPYSISLLSCSSSCRCKQNGFICSILLCPERGGVSLINKSCYHKYTLNECCNTGEVCPSDSTPTCEVDGQKYYEGQKFFPKNTSFHCVCSKDFKGEYVLPFCRKIVCGIQVKYRNELIDKCAPYYKDKEERLCPTSWICPEDGDLIIAKNEGNSNSLQCSYGNKILKFGDYFERKKMDYLFRADVIIKCECLVPPFLTCVPEKEIPW
ncbi:hypothetical protein FQA39_LY15867 [Lamprigera yunnana]|nr:hypothetical protein FQA39_LY15867 [Lamprigera yunnana]